MRELYPWYAVGVKHQHEQSVHSALVFKGFEALAPTYRVRRTWSDRVKDVTLPLFAGYVFSRFPFGERAKIVDTPGVTAIVAFGGRPAEVAASEIAAIQAVMESKIPMRPWPHLKPGDPVRIQRGPLRGLEGTLLREALETRRHLQFVIGIELLQRYVAIEVEPDMIAPVRAAIGTAA